jgi:hypothetical protein
MVTATRAPILCEWCDQPLGRNGGLNIMYRDINAAEQAGMKRELQHLKDWESNTIEVKPLSAVDLAYFAPWRWEHISCGSDGGYFIDGDRIRDSAQAMAWTVHLMEKTWFQYTEWESAMRRAGLVGSTN